MKKHISQMTRSNEAHTLFKLISKIKKICFKHKQISNLTKTIEINSKKIAIHTIIYEIWAKRTNGNIVDSLKSKSPYTSPFDEREKGLRKGDLEHLISCLRTLKESLTGVPDPDIKSGKKAVNLCVKLKQPLSTLVHIV